jgi:3-oxoacyl-[acyl-carrier-protein] synthase II
MQANYVIAVQVRGFGMSSDGCHVTQPHPQGIGAMRCMKLALQDALMEVKHVAYINAHATSTPLGNMQAFVLIPM